MHSQKFSWIDDLMKSTSLLLIAALLALAGCGEKKTAPTADAAAVAAPAAGRLVEITGDDTMRFNVSTIDARAGESLSVRLTNIGKMPKQAMAHNWVLLQPVSEADFNAFGIAAGSAAPTYIPADKAALVITHTKVLGPGESDTVSFKAPEKAGEYPFLCTFPGHFALMKGKLIVK